jgi:hypothetical protein
MNASSNRVICARGTGTVRGSVAAAGELPVPVAAGLDSSAACSLPPGSRTTSAAAAAQTTATAPSQASRRRVRGEESRGDATPRQ